VAGELHQVGANIVADALEADGWDVRFLGTNMPHAGILKVLEEHAPAAIGISATMLFNVPSVRQLVSDIRRGGSGAPRVVLGGAAFRTARELPSEIGADGFAPDVRDAIQVFRSLAPAA
jgi:methanogenic corrinoid protein MtbC1